MIVIHGICLFRFQQARYGGSAQLYCTMRFFSGKKQFFIIGADFCSRLTIKNARMDLSGHKKSGKVPNLPPDIIFPEISIS